jgi:hypothetical protein
MKTIKDQEFGGERPLFASRNLILDNVVIHAGESALKCCENIEAHHCRFEGKYPFWHTTNFIVRNTVFTPGARAALWYSRNVEMTDSQVDAPKMFREMDGVKLVNVNIPDAAETLWHCSNIDLKNVEVKNADYLFMHSHHIRIEDYRQQGNYSFQYCTDVVIRNAHIDSKDAFWNTEDVTVYDSTLSGEYLGWHSRRLKLVRCKISGTQPLCYARDLILEDCTFEPDCDLAFEDAEVNAVVLSPITSVKNPMRGSIRAKSIGEIIIDENSKAIDPVAIKTDEI